MQPGQAVLEAAEPHEGVPVLHGDAFGVAFNHERGNAAPVPLTAGHLRHDDEEVADHSVCRPELDSIEHVLGAVCRRDSHGVQPRRVGTHVGLGQQERAHLTARASRQEPLLLIFGTEHREGLRHTDRLVRGKQSGERG